MADQLKRSIGVATFDLVIHIGVTICALGVVALSRTDEVMYPVVTGASLLLLAARSSIALRRRRRNGEITGENTGEVPPASVRIADLEQRVAELEAVQERVFELEERLDFSERLLVQGSPAAVPRGSAER